MHVVSRPISVSRKDATYLESLIGVRKDAQGNPMKKCVSYTEKADKVYVVLDNGVQLQYALPIGVLDI